MHELNFALSIVTIILLIKLLKSENDKETSMILFLLAGFTFPKIVINDMQGSITFTLIYVLVFVITLIFGFIYRERSKS